MVYNMIITTEPAAFTTQDNDKSSHVYSKRIMDSFISLEGNSYLIELFRAGE